MSRIIFKDHLNLNPGIKQGEEVVVISDKGSHITYRYEIESVSSKKRIFASELDLGNEEQIIKPKKVINVGEEFFCNGNVYKFEEKHGILVLDKVKSSVSQN